MFPVADLIDTLWNVKRYINKLKALKDMDLIDTLWNVKIAGFNDIILNSGSDLIDTLWNVKASLLSPFLLSPPI